MEPFVAIVSFCSFCLFLICVNAQSTLIPLEIEYEIEINSKNYSTVDVTYTDLPSICNDCLVAFYNNDSIIIIQNETVLNKTRIGNTWDTITTNLTDPMGWGLSNLQHNGQSFVQYNNTLYAMPDVSSSQSTEWSDLFIFDLESMDYVSTSGYTSFADTWSNRTVGSNSYRSINGTCLTVSDGILYVIGGYYYVTDKQSQGTWNYSNLVFAYNIETDSWNLTAQLLTARAFAGCASFNDNIYVFGGYNGEAVNQVEKYLYLDGDDSPGGYDWIQLNANVSTSSYLWCSYMEYEGYIYCFGGEDFLQIFDPMIDEFVDNFTVSYPYIVSDPRVAVDDVKNIMYIFDNDAAEWQFIELDPRSLNPTMDPTMDPTSDPTMDPTTYPTMEPTTGLSVRSTFITMNPFMLFNNL